MCYTGNCLTLVIQLSGFVCFNKPIHSKISSWYKITIVAFYCMYQYHVDQQYLQNTYNFPHWPSKKICFSSGTLIKKESDDFYFLTNTHHFNFFNEFWSHSRIRLFAHAQLHFHSQNPRNLVFSFSHCRRNSQDINICFAFF